MKKEKVESLFGVERGERERRRADLGHLRRRGSKTRGVGVRAAARRSQRLVLQRQHARGTGRPNCQQISEAAAAGRCRPLPYRARWPVTTLSWMREQMPTSG